MQGSFLTECHEHVGRQGVTHPAEICADTFMAICRNVGKSKIYFDIGRNNFKFGPMKLSQLIRDIFKSVSFLVFSTLSHPPKLSQLIRGKNKNSEHIKELLMGSLY